MENKPKRFVRKSIEVKELISNLRSKRGSKVNNKDGYFLF